VDAVVKPLPLSTSMRSAHPGLSVRTAFLAARLALSAWANAAESGSKSDHVAVSDDHLVAHWTFDEGQGLAAQDRAGIHHGTLRGAKWTNGVSNSALLFDVSGAYMEIAADAALDMTDELTITAWLKSENFDTPIVNKLTYYAPGNYDFRTERSGGLSLSHENGPGQRMSQHESTGRLTAGRWHHVAVSLKVGGDVRFYIDGLVAGTVRQTGKFGLVNQEPLRIGAKPDPYSSFHGVVDEVRIYRRVLGTGEVNALVSAFRPATLSASTETPKVAAPTIRTTVVHAASERAIDRGAEWPQWQGPNRNANRASAAC